MFAVATGFKLSDSTLTVSVLPTAQPVAIVDCSIYAPGLLTAKEEAVTLVPVGVFHWYKAAVVLLVTRSVPTAFLQDKVSVLML